MVGLILNSSLFSIENIVFTVLHYQISYVELLSVVFGLFSVYFASKNNVLTWPFGLVNVIFLFVLFFQVRLYADMFLQVYFLVITIYGWVKWGGGQNNLPITKTPIRYLTLFIILIILSTLFLGEIIKNIHMHLPNYFIEEASHPYADSFIAICSIVASLLLANKKLESWYFWIMLDIVCVWVFFQSGIIFLTLEYILFLGIASYGLYNWKKQINND